MAAEGSHVTLSPSDSMVKGSNFRSIILEQVEKEEMGDLLESITEILVSKKFIQKIPKHQ